MSLLSSCSRWMAAGWDGDEKWRRGGFGKGLRRSQRVILRIGLGLAQPDKGQGRTGEGVIWIRTKGFQVCEVTSGADPSLQQLQRSPSVNRDAQVCNKHDAHLTNTELREPL